MKSGQQKNVVNMTQDSKSVIGSMGSLGTFIGVQDGSACGTYVTDNNDPVYQSMKFSIDRSQMNKTNDHIGVKHTK